jgi:hypothetical protein
MNCPNPYLALASVTLPREVWWLNTYASQADGNRSQEYARNTALITAMRELAQRKKSLTSEPIDVIASLRRDLSGAVPRAAKASGAVFQVAGGRAFVFAAALGPGARVFEVRPQWSLPDDKWVARNPELWKR